jgi:hypothetical protein
MSETETQIAALEARVAELESQLAVFIERAKDDDESFRSFSERINEYGKRTEKAVSAIHQEFSDELAQFGARLYETFAKDIAAEAAVLVTSDVVAESLTKKVLVTRPAHRGETENVLAIRQASATELRGVK